jgi:hypothetical protein
MMSLPTLLLAQKKKKSSRYHYTQHFKTPKEIEQMESKHDRIYYSFIGHYTNRAQADTASSPLLQQEQEIICIPIWQQRKGEYWFYMGWFAAGSYERALLDGFARLSKTSRDTFEVRAYFLPKDEEYAKYSFEWAQENAFSKTDVKMINKNAQCVGWVVEKKPGVIEWIHESPCPHKISDQLDFIQIQADVTREYIRFYTTFFGPDQQRIFGYERPVGNQFDRISKDNSIKKVNVKKK